MPSQPPEYSGSPFLLPATPRRDGMRDRRRFQGFPLPCSVPDNLERHHPKPMGYTHDQPKSQQHSLHPMWKAGTQAGSICFLDCRAGCRGNWGLPPELLGRQGWLYYECPHSQPVRIEPRSGNTVFPEYLGGSPQAQGAGTGQRIDCSTVRCFSVESRTCSSFLFRVSLCFFLPLVSTAGSAQPLFSSSSLWQMPQDENHSLNRAGWGSPEELPPSLMCLVSSVTALKTNIFAYFAYFTNRECWLLIRYSSGVKVGVFN